MPLRTTSASSRGNSIKNFFIRISSIFIVLVVLFTCLIPFLSVSALNPDDISFDYSECASLVGVSNYADDTSKDSYTLTEIIKAEYNYNNATLTVSIGMPYTEFIEWAKQHLTSEKLGEQLKFSDLSNESQTQLLEITKQHIGTVDETLERAEWETSIPELGEMNKIFSGFGNAYVNKYFNANISDDADENEYQNTDPSDVVSEARDEYEITYYGIITGKFRAPSRSLDDVIWYGAKIDFNIKSGTDLETILDDSDDAFKALMVGAVGSSYAGALKSVTDTTESTKEKLETALDGTRTVSGTRTVAKTLDNGTVVEYEESYSKGETDENLATIHDVLYNVCLKVMVPVAGIVLAFTFAYQIYESVCERNNMNEMGSGFFIQLIIRTCVVILVILFAWVLTEAVFDIGQWIIRVTDDVVQDVIKDNDGLLAKVETYISANPQYTEDEVLIWTIAYYMCINSAIDFGATLSMLVQGLIINIGMYVVSIIVFIIVYVRLIEMYLYCCMAPIPLATMVNPTWQQTGMNFIRSIAALALQGFIIYLCVAIFEVLVSRMINETTLLSTSFSSTMWEVIGYALVLVFCMFKSSSISKSIVGAR